MIARGLLAVGLLLTGGQAFAQVVAVANTSVSEAIAVRCVNTAGAAFEACGGGGGGATQDVNLTAYLGTAFSLTNALHVQPGTGALWDVSDRVGRQLGAIANTSFAATQSGTWNVGTLTTITNPVAVTGTFWQGTQPISGTVGVNNFPASQAVTGTFWQATQPVSGTFFQATQPVSLASVPSHVVTGPLTDGELRATAVPVSGTFWQGTQPVSGAFWQATQPVSIASMPSTPVTGTFWQGTQPVSGAFFQATQPVSLATAPTTPVTGTFWQATQPVSGTVTANAGTNLNTSALVLDATFTGRTPAGTSPTDNESNTNTALSRIGTFPFVWDGATWDRWTGLVTGPVTDAQLRATPVPVSGTVTATGTFWQATQPVSGTFWQATQPVSGTFWQATQPVSAASLPLPTGAATAALQTQPGVDIGDVTVNNASLAVTGTFWQGTQPVSGTFWQATQPISAAALPLPAGAATSALQTQPGVDIGDVTVNNAAGAAAVNVQDGGNTLTVDGTVAVSTTAFGITQTGTNNDVDVATIAAGDANIGNVDIVTMPAITGTLTATVHPAGAGTLLAGTLGATTTAAAIGAGATTRVLVQNDPDNAVDILCGNATTQPLQLKPGDASGFDVNNLNLVFCKTVSSTGTVAYVAR